MICVGKVFVMGIIKIGAVGSVDIDGYYKIDGVSRSVYIVHRDLHKELYKTLCHVMEIDKYSIINNFIYYIT